MTPGWRRPTEPPPPLAQPKPEATLIPFILSDSGCVMFRYVGDDRPVRDGLKYPRVSAYTLYGRGQLVAVATRPARPHVLAFVGAEGTPYTCGTPTPRVRSRAHPPWLTLTPKEVEHYGICPFYRRGEPPPDLLGAVASVRRREMPIPILFDLLREHDGLPRPFRDAVAEVVEWHLARPTAADLNRP